jgi:ribosomal protein S18 acetylase RimI-like enzyme
MSIKICNSQEDQYGNIKENIFLASDDNGSFLGSAYAYPTVNHHQTNETPFLIFISVNPMDNLAKSLEDDVKKKLFYSVFLRAKEIRAERPDLTARIYAGFEYDKDKLDFYLKNGFEEDYVIMMEADIPPDFSYSMPKNLEISELKLNSEQEFVEYKFMHDEIFVTPLDKDEYEEQEKQNKFKNISFLIDGKPAGGCTIFEKDGFGYIETLYVLPEKRGQGFSKDIMRYIFNYFAANGLDKTRLEVWELDKRAVGLYKSFGYNEVGKKMMFPGITL